MIPDDIATGVHPPQDQGYSSLSPLGSPPSFLLPSSLWSVLLCSIPLDASLLLVPKSPTSTCVITVSVGPCCYPSSSICLLSSMMFLSLVGLLKIVKMVVDGPKW
eukprot:Gb_21538 [translate_table: standard]